MFCSLLYAFHFVGDKIASDSFKDETTPLLKSNYRLKFTQDVAMNNVKEMEIHNASSHINYLRNNMYSIHCFTYLHFQK